MNSEMKDYVEELLKSYPDRKREIGVLRYELERPVYSSEDEQIYSMFLTHNDGSRQADSRISDKTPYIAFTYQKQAAKINDDAISGLAARLLELEEDQNRLNYYISLLPPKQAEVLQLFFFKQMKQKEVENILGYSSKTVRKLRNEALATLTKMYRYAAKGR